MNRFVSLLILAILSLPSYASDVVLQGSVDLTPGHGLIGVRVAPSGRVVRVRPASPAENSGIAVGDKIITADGKADVVGRIHGTPGSTVFLTIKRGEIQFVREVQRVNEHMLLPYDAVIAQPDVVVE